MKPRKDLPKPPAPGSPDPTPETTGTPAGQHGELMPRPNDFPDDRPHVAPPPTGDQRRNRSI